MASPDVAVVLATISVDGWFREAVASVLAQEGVRLELIVILDGLTSKDERDVVEYWSGDARVKVSVLPSRQGLPSALRFGIARSSAPLIARLDADDIALPGRLASQKSYLNREPGTVAVGTSAQLIDEQGNVIGVHRVKARNDVRSSLIFRNQIIHPSVMFRRSAYERTSGYNPSFRRMQDYDLWLQLAQIGSIATLDKLGIQYRVHPQQSSRKANPSGDHIDAITAGQRALARSLGLPGVVASVGSKGWKVWQLLRSKGIVKPGFDRRRVSPLH